MTSLLLLSGGPDHAHDFPVTCSSIVDVLEQGGANVTVVNEPDQAAEMLSGSFDALVIHALRWRMLHDRYEPWRAQWGYHTSADTRAAISGYVRAGGGLVGMHTASICFDDWPEWRDVLGGAWNWERSSHPPVGRVSASVVEAAAGHPAMMPGLRGLDLVDEVYGDLDMAPGVEALMVARRTPDDELQPVVWAHQYGDGRVWYDGFGHDAVSVRSPHHAALLRHGVEWVTGGAR